MTTRRPNIVYIVCHDLGKHLGCYGARVDSPNLDAFAANGVAFTHAFCNAPACSPSRACAMTGQYSHTNGELGLAHMGWSLAQDRRTVVDHFNEHGYETAHFGLNHMRHAGTSHYQSDGEKDWEDWDASNAVDNAIEFLSTHTDSETPFYMNVGMGEVHESRWNSNTGEGLRYGPAVPPEDVCVPDDSPDDPLVRKFLGKFQAAIRYMDTHVGRLFDAIDELGLSDNTLVVFTTDHGIANLRSKGTIYDRGVEIALLVQTPGRTRRDIVVDALIQNIDLAPTLLAAAGVPVPDEMQGNSFWPLLAGGAYEPHKQVFIERNYHGEYPEGGGAEPDFVDMYDPVRAVRTRHFHYLRYFEPEKKHRAWLPDEVAGRLNADAESFGRLWPQRTEPRAAEELFCVIDDPQERTNLAANPQYATIKADLIAKLEQWMRQTDDHVLRGETPERPEEPGWDWSHAENP